LITEEKRNVLEKFSEGRRYYKMMDFSRALRAFEEALALDPEDGPSIVYVERCKFYLENPPPEDWDGVFVMKTK
jgi:tetratricopeptide (TPR) repeat protein